MTSQLDTALEALFPASGNRAVNVKFFRGHAREVTAEQLASQLNLASMQIASGLQPVADIDAD